MDHVIPIGVSEMHYWSRTPGPLLYAHRGASREYPENTVAAFRRAAELGADVLEMDVRTTRDGVWVVSHDENGARTCGVARTIRDCRWAEVRDWDAGWGFIDERGERPHAGRGIRIARFDEVLEESGELGLNVDVKQPGLEQVRSLISTIRAQHAEDRVLLTSFASRVVAAIRRAGYAGPIGLSRWDVVRLRFVPRWRPPGMRAQIPRRSGPVDLATAGFVGKCHRLGLGVDFWVINDEAEAETLLDLGADGIVTDDCSAMASVFRRSVRTSAWRGRHG